MILPLLSISPIPVQLGLCVQVLQEGLIALPLAHHSLALAELYPGCPQGIGLRFLWPAQVLVSGIWGQWEQGTGAQRGACSPFGSLLLALKLCRRQKVLLEQG